MEIYWICLFNILLWLINWLTDWLLNKDKKNPIDNNGIDINYKFKCTNKNNHNEYNIYNKASKTIISYETITLFQNDIILK